MLRYLANANKTAKHYRAKTHTFIDKSDWSPAFALGAKSGGFKRQDLVVAPGPRSKSNSDQLAIVPA